MLAITSPTTQATDARAVVEASRQCIVVTTDSWAGSSGTAQWFDRRQHGAWQLHGRPAPVVVGRRGLAWGLGEMNTFGLPGPIKHEGDDTAPAGIFRLGTAFGYAPTAKPLHLRLPYLPLSSNIVAVDDPNSRYYNHLVDTRRVTNDWRSAEKMILADDRYKWGVQVLYNAGGVPGAGSCIFLHVWKSSVTPTSGCTAMAEEDLLRLLGWLDPARQPLLSQMPRSIYNKLQKSWNLPSL